MDKLNEIKEEVVKFSKLEAISTSPGGKLLVNSLQKDITSCVDELSRKYKEASHIELIAIIAQMSEKLALLRVLNKAKKNKKIAKEDLDLMLKEGQI